MHSAHISPKPAICSKSASKSESSGETPLVTIITIVLNSSSELSETIRSVEEQNYSNIEHIIIDGGSTDSTLSVITAHEHSIAKWVSEPDGGIYDAINKGICLSSGDWIAILHAGDRYAPDFVQKAVEATCGNPMVIPYCGHYLGQREMQDSPMSDGIFLHHLGINHCTFLVPRHVYEGLKYSSEYSIVGDVVWTSQAYEAGFHFRRFEGHYLHFAAGGKSSAKTEKERKLLIREAVTFFKSNFPFVPDNIAECLYLYRFNEGTISELSEYISCLRVEDRRACSVFLSALREMLKHLWKLRPLNIDVSENELKYAKIRIELANTASVSCSALNIDSNDTNISDVLSDIASLRHAIGKRKVVLHYVEEFSRRTETFIADFINRLQEADSRYAHVVVCDRRVLKELRAAPFLFTFDYPKFSVEFSAVVMSELLSALSPKRFIFHFAINGWRFLSRVDPSYRLVPTIFMFHGIDVFALANRSEYRDFILNVAAKLPNAAFTVVSDYLRQALVKTGVPINKITRLHNCVHPQFFAHRRSGAEKLADREQSPYTVRLLNIGRLIALKGHATLLKAIGVLRSTHNIEASLRIVYGGEDEELENLIELASRESITDLVEFQASVDFKEDSEFFSEFDLFVSPSTYSLDSSKRSEAFGISILEAIASGLPVIVTDAGGQSGTVGPEGKFNQIVKRDDPVALAATIAEMISSGVLDLDNLAYARERLDRFSELSQLDIVRAIFEELEVDRLSVALFSTTITGGAGHAALRVHQSLLLNGNSSRLYTSEAELTGQEAAVIGLPGSNERPQPFVLPNHTIFSVDTLGIPDSVINDIVNTSDVISIHWSARFLSLDNIARLSNSGKPVVITIRDMNPLTGGCHFFHGCDNWEQQCLPCPQFLPSNLHLPGATFEAKASLWNYSNIVVVVMSDHTREIVQRSPLLGQCRIEKIPNPIDTSIFRPKNRFSARAEFGIPTYKRVIAYLPSYNSSVKGQIQAWEALKAASGSLPLDECVLVCAGRPDASLEAPVETIMVGYISDKEQLARFYSSANVTLVPSLEETFSNTAAESVACGTPVVGFKTGAIPEIAQGARGRSVTVGDSEALGGALVEILMGEPAPRAELHRYTVENFGSKEVGQHYTNLFRDLQSEAASQKGNPIEVQQASVEQNDGLVRFRHTMDDYVERRLLSERARFHLRDAQRMRDAQRTKVEINNITAELRRVHQSWSWKLTMPVRAIRQLVLNNQEFRKRLRSSLVSIVSKRMPALSSDSPDKFQERPNEEAPKALSE